MTEFNIPGLVNCDKIFSNKYGLFKIKVERGDDSYHSYHSNDESKRIFLYKWQNSWEVVFETKVSKSFYPHDRIEEIVKMSEAMFAPYNEVNKVGKTVGFFLNKLKQYAPRFESLGYTN
jgi:predicted nucleotidyltransferase